MLLSPIFFASIGIEMKIPSINSEIILMTIVLVLVAMLSKVIGCGLGAKICGYNKNEVIDDFQHLNDNDESNLFLNTNVDFQSNINKNVSNKSFIRYKGIGSILGVIAIVILIPRVISAFNELGNCFENMYLSFRYDSGVRAFLFLINSILILAQPLILIALSALLFSDFIKFKKTIRIITPIIIVSVFTLLIFIIGSIAIRFIDFIPFIDLIYYIIPVILIIIGNCINEK